jgi:hypothetical protein
MNGAEVKQAIHSHVLDQLPLEALFVLIILLMVFSIEIGFRIGRRPQIVPAKAQHSQVRAIMGAALGLTAFMLAFTFATAQSHYETRVQAMLMETRMANDAFLQAEFMPEPDRSEARSLLRQYVVDRLAIHDLARQGRMEEVVPLVARAEELHGALWELAAKRTRIGTAEGESPLARDPFMQSVIGLMDMHSARVEASMLNRIHYVIWVTLYFTGFLAMMITGYQAGLVGKRSPFATVGLALIFATVMMLITDLDRPFMSLFDINDRVVENTVERMDAFLALDGEQK